MDKNIKKLLVEAKEYREKGLFDKVLGNLHQIVDEYPNNFQYKYLLASAYFEAGSEDSGEYYAKEIIEAEPNSKEALELLGLICVKNAKYEEIESYLKKAQNTDPDFHNARMSLTRLYYEEAESYLKKALNVDPDFLNARMNLIRLYDKHLQNDLEMEKNCEYMIAHRDSDKDTYSMEKKLSIILDWYAYVYSRLKEALARQGKYERAIEVCEEYIRFDTSSSKQPNPLELINEYGSIYKFYYLMKDKEKLEEFKERYKSIYFYKTEQELEFDYNFFEKWADEGIF